MQNRFLQRERNRTEDIAVFEKLITHPMSKIHRNQPQMISTMTKGKGSTRKVKDPAFDEVVDRGNKIVSNICRLLSGYPGFEGVEYDDPSTVSLEMISNIARQVVNGDLLIQLMMCREPNRQTSDEIVQFEIRKKYLEPQGWRVENLPAGQLTLENGKWVHNNAASVAKSEKTKARSIDFKMTKGKITVMDFAKFALVAGGVQDHQIKESKYFLTEVKKYIDNNNDTIYFVDTLDGKYAERSIEAHRMLLKGYEKRVFVGNTEQVINWIEKLA